MMKKILVNALQVVVLMSLFMCNSSDPDEDIVPEKEEVNLEPLIKEVNWTSQTSRRIGGEEVDTTLHYRNVYDYKDSVLVSEAFYFNNLADTILMTFEYDEQGRVTARNYGSSNLKRTFEYDSIGRLINSKFYIPVGDKIVVDSETEVIYTDNKFATLNFYRLSETSKQHVSKQELHFNKFGDLEQVDFFSGPTGSKRGDARFLYDQEKTNSLSQLKGSILFSPSSYRYFLFTSPHVPSFGTSGGLKSATVRKYDKEGELSSLKFNWTNQYFDRYQIEY
ncbi:MAG: hypothetical protein JXR03_10670 [Cyclobacteriaceae bacterium]